MGENDQLVKLHLARAVEKCGDIVGVDNRSGSCLLGSVKMSPNLRACGEVLVAPAILLLCAAHGFG